MSLITSASRSRCIVAQLLLLLLLFSPLSSFAEHTNYEAGSFSTSHDENLSAIENGSDDVPEERCDELSSSIAGSESGNFRSFGPRPDDDGDKLEATCAVEEKGKWRFGLRIEETILAPVPGPYGGILWVPVSHSVSTPGGLFRTVPRFFGTITETRAQAIADAAAVAFEAQWTGFPDENHPNQEAHENG